MSNSRPSACAASRASRASTVTPTEKFSDHTIGIRRLAARMASPCAPLIPVVPMTSGIRRRAAPESSMGRFSGAEKSSAASSPLSASRLSQPPRPTWPITRTSSRRAQTASSVRPILPLPTMAIFKGLHLRHNIPLSVMFIGWRIYYTFFCCLCAFDSFRHACGVPPSSKRKVQLIDINKFGLDSKIKKFSDSFICGKGYSPPFGGRIAFCLQSAPSSKRKVLFARNVIYAKRLPP